MSGTTMRGLNEAMRALGVSSRAGRRTVASGMTAREGSARQQSGLQSRSFSRSMATEAPLPIVTTAVDPSVNATPSWLPTATVPVTIHAFPSLEPRSLENWSVKHLQLPLRRDLLHLAVVYEGDKTRQGTASTKTRGEVKASNRKIRPQKGSGRARLGNAASPMLRGGGVVFGPHPRDFSTRLNQKMYDVAWRTALSYRYRRGELLVCENGSLDLPLPRDFTDLVETGYLGDQLANSYRLKAAEQLLDTHRWGRSFGRTTFITTGARPELFTAVNKLGEEREARALALEEVDVKDLLETARIVIEREALREMIEAHRSDLVTRVVVNGIGTSGPALGETVVA